MTPEQARADERAKVVAWLREDAARTRADITKLHKCHALNRAETATWEALLSLKIGLADAIERGDHHKEQGE